VLKERPQRRGSDWSRSIFIGCKVGDVASGRAGSTGPGGNRSQKKCPVSNATFAVLRPYVLYWGIAIPSSSAAPPGIHSAWRRCAFGASWDNRANCSNLNRECPNSLTTSYFFVDVSNIDQRFEGCGRHIVPSPCHLASSVTESFVLPPLSGGPLCLTPKPANLNCRYKTAWRYTPHD
jgi:hypothetical protein